MKFQQRNSRRAVIAITGILTAVLAVALFLFFQRDSAPAANPSERKSAALKPALTVTVTQPKQMEWPRSLAANGNIAAWQEVVIAPEISGFRIIDVLVNVGDVVKSGQPLLRISADTVAADLAQARASIAEAEATVAEARANAQRTRDLQDKGFVSSQAGIQSATAEQTALARLQQAQAKMQAEQVRLGHTRIVAPDDGVISARNAAVGSLASSGEELFRLIRDNRLEWRAEVTGAELGLIKNGMPSSVVMPGGERITGTVRAIAPTVDSTMRTAIVYVDLPVGSPARAGMFARGTFELGRGSAYTIPQSSVILREGFHYVLKVGPDNRIAQTKVTVGQTAGDRVEIIEGIEPTARVVATGAAFLADGDTVRVVEVETAAGSAAPAIPKSSDKAVR